MKIAVTGHTKGIGLYIAQWMQNRGHEVIGFSRATGHDISQDHILDQIVDTCYDCDIFFNNAQHEFQQTRLLFQLYDSWQNQKRTIVNIGSSFTQRWDHGHRHPMYRTTKRSLDDACQFLWTKTAWPRIVLAKPCVTDTPKSAWYAHPNKVSANDMADMICQAVTEQRCRIQEISFEVNPQ